MTTAPEETELPLPDRVSTDFLYHHRVCPVGALPDGALAVAVTEASLLGALDDLSVAYDRRVVPRTVPAQELDVLLARLRGPDDSVALEHPAPDDEAFTSDARDLANQPPVVRYVNLLIREAYDAGASDIHLESTRDGLRTRFRLDG